MKRPGKITSSSVFVVSGGARGITAHCVIQLARRYACAFLLLGRSARTSPESAWVEPGADEATMKQQIIAHLSAQGTRPTPAGVQKILQAVQAEQEISATLRAIEAAGGRAEYLSVDITDAAAVQAVLPAALQRYGLGGPGAGSENGTDRGSTIGLIHGAGSLADKLIEKKSAADFDHVYTVKIGGLQNLLACIALDRLDYLVLFSSVAGFYGNVGQADYAIANDILNKTAHRIRRTHPGCQVVSINWGPWEGGMVTPALRRYFAQHNIPLISLDAGAEMLIRELEVETPTPPPQVVVGTPIVRPAAPPAPDLRSHRIRRHLSLEANPFLYDHVIGGHPVLPAVFGVSWMTNSCEQLYPGHVTFGLRDFKVLKGIVFDETIAESYTLDLQEKTKTETGEIVLDALVWSETAAGKRRYHYTTEITLCRDTPPPPTYPACDLRETHVIPGPQLYEDGTLFHGPSFQGIERTLNIGPQKVTMECCSPEVPLSHQGQFPIQTFHPYRTDIQFQCMLIWVRRTYGAGGMPLGADLVEDYRRVPPGARFYVSMDVQETTPSKLIATVTAHDRDGLIYMRVSGTRVTISTRLNSLFAQSRATVAAPRS